MVMIIALLIESNFGHDAPDVTIEYFHRDGDNKDIRSRNINIFLVTISLNLIFKEYAIDALKYIAKFQIIITKKKK